MDHDIITKYGGKYKSIQPMHWDNLKKLPSFPQNTDLGNCPHHMSFQYIEPYEASNNNFTYRIL